MKNTILLIGVLALAGCGHICTCQDQVEESQLANWAQEDPELASYMITSDSDDTLRCLEIATGAELTEAELEATLPDEINSVCPELANPNYQET